MMYIIIRAGVLKLGAKDLLQMEHFLTETHFNFNHGNTNYILRNRIIFNSIYTFKENDCKSHSPPKP